MGCTTPIALARRGSTPPHRSQIRLRRPTYVVSASWGWTWRRYRSPRVDPDAEGRAPDPAPSAAPTEDPPRRVARRGAAAADDRGAEAPRPAPARRPARAVGVLRRQRGRPVHFLGRPVGTGRGQSGGVDGRLRTLRRGAAQAVRA